MFDLRESWTQLRSLFIPGEVLEATVLQHEPLPKRKEQRRSARVEMELLLTAITSDKREFHGYCRDLSREGAAAIIWGELEVGDRVDLVYRLSPEAEEITMPAIVRRAACCRYGLEFCPEDESELNRFLIDTCCAFA